MIETTYFPDPATIMTVLNNTRTIAVVGLSSQPERPGNYVPAYLQQAGYRIIPVNPNLTEALGEKVYVVGIDMQQNAVIIGPQEALFSSELISCDNNFVLIEKLEEPMQVQAQIRYNAQPVPAAITPLGNGKVHVRFETPQRAVTPGQAVVYYQDDYLVGGGTIRSESRKCPD